MDQLKLFYDNKLLAATVHAYLIETLQEVALDKLFKGEDAKEAKMAKEVVDYAFSKLRDAYEPLKKANIKNKAR